LKDFSQFCEITQTFQKIQTKKWTDFTVLNLYCIKGALALFVLVSFSGCVC